MSRLIRGNLYDLSSDGMYRMVMSNDLDAKSRSKADIAFHNNLDSDGRPYTGSLVICRSSALGKADNTGVVTEAFSAGETKKMGSYGQLIKVMSPSKNGQEVSLFGNYDTIDFEDIESYLDVYSDNYKKRIAFLENVAKTERMKNTLVKQGRVQGTVTRHTDRILERLERPVPSISFADIDIGHSLG